MRTRFALAMLLVVQLVLGSYGIAQRVVWGHAGWHLAEHGASVRNFLAHGTWIPAAWYERTEPPRASFSFHHPFLLHPYLAASVAVFGEHPWAFRIVPLAFSVVALVALFAFTRRARDPATALLAVALFVLHPSNLAFSHLPDHQIVAIAWALIAFVFMLRWLYMPRWLDALGFLVPSALAGLTDWPWYPTALFAWLMMGARVLRAEPGGPFAANRAQRHGRIVLIVFALIVGTTFAQHFVTAEMLGRWGSIQDGFFGRSGSIPTHTMLTALWRRDRTMHAVILPVLAAVWLAWVLRARRRDPATLLMIAWILGATTHLILFRREFALHEYRTHWYVPAFAFAVADGMRAFARRDEHVRWRRVVPVALVLVWVGSFGAYAWWRARRTGGVMDMDLAAYTTHDDEFALAAMTDAHRHPYDRGFAAVSSYLRVEVPWLAHCDITACLNPAPVFRTTAKGTPVIVFGEWPALRDAPGWRDLASSAHAIVLGGHAMLVRHPDEPVEVETWHLVQPTERRSALDAYLHASWLRDPIAVR